MYLETARFDLLSPDGTLASPPHAAILEAPSHRFLSCTALCGVRLTLRTESRVASVRLLFALGRQTDAQNSWVRELQLPPKGALRLDGIVAEEQRFPLFAGDTGLGPDGVLVELRLAPRSCSELTLRFPPGPFGLMQISAHDEHHAGEPHCEAPVPDLPSYPPSQAALPRRGDPLADQLRAEGEPSLAGLWRLALPYRGGALLGAPGVPDLPLARANWDGGIVLPHRDGEFDRIWFKLDLGPLGALSATSSQGLLDGWLPVSVVRTEGGGWQLLQTALVDLRGNLRVRWQLEATGSDALPITPRLRAARSRIQQAEQAQQKRAVHEPLTVRMPAGSEGGEGALGPLPMTLSPLPELLLPGGRVCVDLLVPLAQGAQGGDFDGALAALRSSLETYLDLGARLDLPDPLLQDLWRALVVHNHLFIRGGKMRYGLFPGVYEDAIFGVEEGWNIVALSMYGHGAEAKEVLARTFFDAEFLSKEGQHHQYRNGLAPTYALDVFRLTGDRDWLSGLYPRVIESASFIEGALRSTQVELEGERPPSYGLMPKHTYGGDLKDPTYSLYGSSACWRGLRDSALIAGILDDAASAARFRDAAAEARGHMHEAAARIYKRDGRPSFLPFRVDEVGVEPSAGDYHQLFASLILETALFGWDGPFARGITDYLHETGRQVLGVARFDEWFGRLGVDAEYSRGFQLTHLVRRRFDDFWLGLIGQIGLSCDPFTFVSPETAIVRFDRADHQDRMRALAMDPRRFDSDPCSAGTAVMLQYLRYLLVFEERDEADLPTGTLWISSAVPASWFRPGTSFSARGLPTAFGPVSFRCSISEQHIEYEVETSLPVPMELFFIDAGGKRRSRRVACPGGAHFTLSRNEDAP